MDALEFLKVRSRMTNNCTINCDECLLHYKNNNHELYCNKLEDKFCLEELSMLQRAKDILQECVDEIYEENLEESDVEEK